MNGHMNEFGRKYLRLRLSPFLTYDMVRGVGNNTSQNCFYITLDVSKFLL